MPLGRLVIVCRAAQLDSIVSAVLLSVEDWVDFQQQCRDHCHEHRENKMCVMPKYRKLEWVTGPMRKELCKMELIEEPAPPSSAKQELCVRGAGIVPCLLLMMSE